MWKSHCKRFSVSPPPFAVYLLASHGFTNGFGLGMWLRVPCVWMLKAGEAARTRSLDWSEVRHGTLWRIALSICTMRFARRSKELIVTRFDRTEDFALEVPLQIPQTAYGSFGKKRTGQKTSFEEPSSWGTPVFLSWACSNTPYTHPKPALNPPQIHPPLPSGPQPGACRLTLRSASFASGSARQGA